MSNDFSFLSRLTYLYNTCRRYVYNFQKNVYFSGGTECGFPGTPRNGSLVESSAGLLYQMGENVTYECQMSFVLFGPNYRTCQENGTWSGTVPECRKFTHTGLKSETKCNLERM